MPVEATASDGEPAGGSGSKRIIFSMGRGQGEQGGGMGQGPRPRGSRPPQGPAPVITGFEGFSDDPEAPYAQSEKRSLTPQQTWNAVNETLAALIAEIAGIARRAPILVTPEHLKRWHRRLFGADFRDGGVYRSGHGYYHITYDDGAVRRTIQLRGSDPERIHRELGAICSEWERHISAAKQAGGVESPRKALEAALSLYIGILRVHPFRDGNARVASAALQAALTSQDLPVTALGEDWARFELCLGAALRPDDGQSVEPLVGLTAELLNATARRMGWDTIDV